jgi:prepilin-type processing-associated H-X9-DG protein
MWELLDPSGSIDLAAPTAPVNATPIAYCASDTPWTITQLSQVSTQHREATYALNGFLSYTAGTQANPEVKQTRVDAVRNASNKILLIETHHFGMHGVRPSMAQAWPHYGQPVMAWETYIIAGFVDHPSYQRHIQGFNSSFVDGHVSFIRHTSDPPITKWYMDPWDAITYSTECPPLWDPASP